MPKFSMDINGVDVDAAEERHAWAGELPPNGSYEGILKIVSIGNISQTAKIAANRGKPKLNICVELKNTQDGKYDGFPAWTTLNLIESSLPFVNQFLRSLTDGSEAQFTEIKKAFYNDGPVVDETRKHITKIGRWKIESPEGKIPVKVSIQHKNGFFNPETKQTSDPSSRIDSFLVGTGGGPSGGGNSNSPITDAPVEDEIDDVDVDPEDEIDTDPATEEDEAGEAVDSDDMFEEEEADANA